MKTSNKNRLTGRVRVTKTKVMRFRCDDAMRTEVAKVAYLQGLDESDIMRQAINRFIQQFNRSMPSMPQADVLNDAR